MAKVWGYRKDPMKHPLKTPSGKIEIYSEQLARETADWETSSTTAKSPM